MSNEVRALEPQSVWNHFADLNEVPRPSKKEERVIQFMVDFGNKLGLPTEVDHIGNVFIRKASSLRRIIPSWKYHTTLKQVWA